MGQLRLIWYTTKRQVIIYHLDLFTFESPNHDHMWSVRIDALNGKLFENDLLFHANLIEIFAHEEAGSESFYIL
jgi:hypothetical protein